MSRNYKQSEDIPNGVLAKRLEELSDAVVARMHGKKHVFDNEFTCRIPAELDRDADLVLMESAKRLEKLS